MHYRERLDIKEFEASKGWLDQWKRRCLINVSFKTLSVEEISYTQDDSTLDVGQNIRDNTFYEFSAPHTN